jgi:nucleoside-diphosphate kinase
MAKKNLKHLQAKIPGFERVLVAIKPDGVKRALTGEVIRRLEMVGLKMVAGKMEVPTVAKAKGNYPDISTKSGKEWMIKMGKKTLKTFKNAGKDIVSELGTDDPEVLGQKVYDSLIKYLTSGPMVAMVWEGHDAVDRARAIAGDTTPIRAGVGTIRGDLTFESQILSNLQGRIALANLVHVSGDPDEALEEIAYWFGEDAEFNDDYIRTDHLAMFGEI